MYFFYNNILIMSYLKDDPDSIKLLDNLKEEVNKKLKDCYLLNDKNKFFNMNGSYIDLNSQGYKLEFNYYLLNERENILDIDYTDISDFEDKQLASLTKNEIPKNVPTQKLLNKLEEFKDYIEGYEEIKKIIEQKIKETSDRIAQLSMGKVVSFFTNTPLDKNIEILFEKYKKDFDLLLDDDIPQVIFSLEIYKDKREGKEIQFLKDGDLKEDKINVVSDLCCYTCTNDKESHYLYHANTSSSFRKSKFIKILIYLFTISSTFLFDKNITHLSVNAKNPIIRNIMNKINQNVSGKGKDYNYDYRYRYNIDYKKIYKNESNEELDVHSYINQKTRIRKENPTTFGMLDSLKTKLKFNNPPDLLDIDAKLVELIKTKINDETKFQYDVGNYGLERFQISINDSDLVIEDDITEGIDRINVIRDTYVIGEPTFYNFSLLIKSKLTKSRIQRLINQKLSEEIFGISGK